MNRLFDQWPERYDQWFETDIGRLVRKFETELLLDLLRPGPGELILDAGCGTGIFTADLLQQGAAVVGLELSLPMLIRAASKLVDFPFLRVQGDMLALPFGEDTFDKTISVTAIEFIPEASVAMSELLRVTRPGGVLVVATLNGRSAWASRRKRGGHELFDKAIFRTPAEMESLLPFPPLALKTAIHFSKDQEPEAAAALEKEVAGQSLDGAFLAAAWRKPPA